MSLKGVDAWLGRLNATELPVLGGVISTLNKLTDSDDTHVKQLSELILKDSNLTSQLLRVANSIHYNPGGSRITTVTRAIVQVGFEGVKNICISLMLVDNLLSGQPRERLLHVMALAFHAALQARAMTEASNSDDSEQVFIAALLFHVGEMAVWSKGGTQADELDRLLLEGVKESDACEQVLGMQFKSLTRALVQSWRLSPLLEAVMRSSTAHPLAKSVLLANRLVAATEFGWDSKPVKTLLQQVADYRNVSVERATNDALHAASLAEEFSRLFGVPVSGVEDEQVKLGVKVGQPDTGLQMQVLKKLSGGMRSGLDFSGIFQLVVEGLYLGVAFARVAVVLKLQDKLVARFCAGKNEKLWRKKFVLNASEVNFFTEVLNYKTLQHFNRDRLQKCSHLFTDSVQELIDCKPCVVAPVMMNNRVGGIYYVDNDGAEITLDQIESLEFFVQQAQMMLQSAAMRIKT